LTVEVSKLELSKNDYVENSELQPGKYVKLSVSDTGHGVPVTVRDRIFEPYFTTKAKDEGTGLGLSVVHGIVKNHGGHITVYSEEGKGTIFNVYLPKVVSSAVAKEDEIAEDLVGGHERIWLVDDDDAIVKLEKRILEGLGYEVRSFISGEDFLKDFISRYSEVDLVITDMTMPGLTGTELAQKIRTIRMDVPIILCSGFSEVINEHTAKMMGIEDYILKPVVRSRLANAVRSVLDNNKSL
jgi:CheY-like chemotaxis protein